MTVNRALFTSRADLTDQELSEVVRFATTGELSEDAGDKVILAADVLTRPSEDINSGMGIVTLGRFVAGAGNVILVPEYVAGDVMVDTQTPDGLYLTTLQM